MGKEGTRQQICEVPFFVGMGKIVGLTYDLKTDRIPREDDPVDIHAEFDQPATIDRIALSFERGGHTVKRIGNVHNLLAQLDSLEVDIVFNICEGDGGRNRESQVPVLLEMKGIPFVGADGLTLGITLDKAVAKKMFQAEGIPTARYFVAKDTRHLDRLNTIGFPLIVKALHEGTSKGLSKDSRVEDTSALKRQVQRIHDIYRQPALVEEFIRGTEFTVVVLGNDDPRAMPIIQFGMEGRLHLGDEFYTSERVFLKNVQYICPAKIPDHLAEHLQALAVRVYQCVGCRDFGRVDFRVDEQGNPYVLEINPLPSLNPEDTFGTFIPAIGSNYDAVLNRILNFALRRYGLLAVHEHKKLEESFSS